MGGGEGGGWVGGGGSVGGWVSRLGEELLSIKSRSIWLCTLHRSGSEEVGGVDG